MAKALPLVLPDGGISGRDRNGAAAAAHGSVAGGSRPAASKGGGREGGREAGRFSLTKAGDWCIRCA